MVAGAMLLDPPEEFRVSAVLQPWSVSVRASPRCGQLRVESPEHLVALSARLGIELSFGDVGYQARFTVVATDPADAAATARRRWFYLADDLGLPRWLVTDVSVASIDA